MQAKGEKVLKASLTSIMTQTPKAIDQEALAWDALRLMEADQKTPRHGVTRS